jgi:Helix-turn-helix domain
MHVNQTTGACFPSYATIARLTGIHRSTVIECVKKLKALKLVFPEWRFKEDGSHTSNQYDFQGTGTSAPSTAELKNQLHSAAHKGSSTAHQGSRPEQPAVVAEAIPPSRPERPEQSEKNKKKERTIAEVNFYPTEKQKTCQHPAPAIVHLSDNITICHHCYGLLDENLQLVEEETAPSAQAA